MEDMPEHLRGKGGIPYGKAGVLRSLVLILLAVSLVIGGYLWAEKEVTIYVDGETVVKKTLQRDVGGLLQEAGIKLGPQDLTEPEPSVLLTSGMEVTVRRAVPFTVVVDGERKNLLSAQATVGLALEEAGIDLSRQDRTEPDFTSPVVPGMEIEVIRVEKELVTAQASIPYQVLRRNDSNMLTGQAKVIKEGKEGLVERTLADNI
ncbi:MAG: ubiquitin-like domain-containing protein [bacterium]